MSNRRISCHRHGDVLVVDISSEARFYLTGEEIAAFVDALEAEITYRRLQVEVFDKTGSADAPIIIADASFTQQEARRLLTALQSVLEREDEPRLQSINWRREGF